MVKKTLMISLISSLILGPLSAAVIEGNRIGEVRVVPVEPTPEPDHVKTHLVFPQADSIKNNTSDFIQIRLEAYALGYDSQIPRAREIRNSREGQALHILIDSKPFISVNEAIDELAEPESTDYDQTVQTRIPYKLKKGGHVLRIFPIRSFGESLKGPGCFTAAEFFIDEKEKTKYQEALQKPYLTYNMPYGEFSHQQPVLLDFYVTNIQLSSDGYKVRVIIDGADKRILTQWVPYYIYGLKSGSHTIKLELLDPSNKVLTPLFDNLSETIVIN